MTTWGMTVRVPATLHFTDGTEIAGALHLQSAVASHPGAETVAELLNRPEPFLPLSLDEDGVRFVPKAPRWPTSGTPIGARRSGSSPSK